MVGISILKAEWAESKLHSQMAFGYKSADSSALLQQASAFNVMVGVIGMNHQNKPAGQSVNFSARRKLC